MRKLTSLGLCCLLIAYLAVGVCAATGVSGQESFATVSADGSCQVTTTVTFHLESPMEKLRFPIPKEATGVTLNGSRVSASRSGDVRLINLSRLTKNVVGDVTVSIHYNLYDVISATDTGLQMQVPLLSGFDYPVESLRFSVTLPGAVEVLPGFVSGYHQARIEEDLTYSMEGATISGHSLKAMKDHETLYMTLAVTEDMFPQSITQSQDYHWGTTGMLVCAVLALVYWLLTLWNLPVFPQRSTQPPQSYHPGQAGSLLAGQGLNLTMAVLHWAQLGYLTIVPQRNRIMLYKRMEMGNERTEGEIRVFDKLFGKRTGVDTSDYRYAQLFRTCAKQCVGRGDIISKWSGNNRIFRFLAAGIGLFGGASLAVAMADGAALQGVLLVLLAVAGFLSGWYIQGIGAGLLLGESRKIKISLGISGAWLVIGLLAGDWNTALSMVVWLLLAGLLLCWGGRRTREGRQMLAQLLGLRRHLTRGKHKQLLENEPDYFFRMLPWAMALGCGKGFAKAFGKEKMENCTYLAADTPKAYTAAQWYGIFQETVKGMNHRGETLPLEKFFGMLQAITRR